MKVLDWNIGSFYFIKLWRSKYRGKKIINEYFQPALNGRSISNYLEEENPDLIFLQEIYKPTDLKSIEILREYKFRELIDTWYHKHSVLIASKKEFEVIQEGKFSVIKIGPLHFAPIHLNSFQAKERLKSAKLLVELQKKYENLVILGDTNLWSRKGRFFFKRDREAYRTLRKSFRDFSYNVLPTYYMGFKLDRVFASESVQIKNISSPRVRGAYMDHYPIVFDVN